MNGWLEAILVIVSAIGLMVLTYLWLDTISARINHHPSLIEMVLAYSLLTEEEMEQELKRIKERAKQRKNRKGR